MTAALAAAPVTLLASTLHVPAEYSTIQAGLDAAAPGDTVLIACGTYYEHDLVIRVGVCLRSESGEADCVTIDGEYWGRILDCDDILTQVCIEGITFYRGYSAYQIGGGLHCDHSTLQLENVVFRDNVAFDHGGGIASDFCDLAFVDVRFEGNSSETRGGGLYCYMSPFAAQNVAFVGNSANEGGGLFASGTSSSTLTGSIFTGNTATHLGGGLHCQQGCQLLLENVVIGEGTAVGGAGIAVSGSITLRDVLVYGNSASEVGGGVRCYQGAPVFESVTLWGNSAPLGGALYLYQTNATVDAVTMAANSAGVSGAGIYCFESSPQVSNTVIAYSTLGEGIWGLSPSEPMLSCCDVFANAGGDYGGDVPDQTGFMGNISADPMFCDAPSGDFTVAEESPCAPSANPCGQLVGAHGIGCSGATPVESVSWGMVKSLFR
jgi:predicted outer membrane repeat protein